jgi:hypothetical protein
VANLVRQGELIEADGLADEALETFADRFQRIFQGLARQMRQARRAIQENHRLRQENHELREALVDCVDACGRYLSPALQDRSADPDQDDHARARAALEHARCLLEGAPRLLGPPG